MTERLRIIAGDALAVMKTLPDESVHMCVTSPPYWGLRKYGDWRMQCLWGEHGDWRLPRDRNKAKHHLLFLKIRADRTGIVWSPNRQEHICALGLEPTPELFMQHMVDIFREVRRVLRRDGTLWLNIGDSYARQAGDDSTKPADTGFGEGHGTGRTGKSKLLFKSGNNVPPPGLKPKDLCGIPWRLAFALKADGWWLRQDIIWDKVNPMPESVQDRCCKSHEYIFLLSKSSRYFFDQEAIKEPCSDSTHARISQNLAAQVGSFRANGGNKTNGPMKAVIAGSTRKIAESGSGIAANESYEASRALVVSTRTKRSVWRVTTEGYSEAHFATYPPDLIKPCILAGTSARGCCPKCGAPWERVVDVEYIKNRPSAGNDPRIRNEDRANDARGHGGWKGNNLLRDTKTTGWRPTCKCNQFEQPCKPCTVLDPFFGSGTTGQVSLELGRSCIGIELNPAYLKLAERRCHVTPGLALA